MKPTFKQYLTEQWDKDEEQGRLRMLQSMIGRGKIPVVKDARWSRGDATTGDLARLGYLKEEKHRTHGSMYDVYWRALKPIKFRVVTGAGTKFYNLQPGDKTESVEVDYS